MQLRIVSVVIVLAIGLLAFLAWNMSTKRAEPPAAVQGGAEAPMGGMPGASAQDPGIEWQTPKRWVEELASGMRLATYVIPAQTTGGEGAKCAVYYFGPGQGGGIEANIERWIGEFQNPGQPKRRSFEVRGLKVAQVEVTGTFVSHAMQPGETREATSGWTLLGAIVEGPQGAVFFKLTGPTDTVAPATKEFEGLLASMRKK